MIPIASDKVTPALRSLFRTDEPQVRRCFAVLDGIAGAGKTSPMILPIPHGVWFGKPVTVLPIWEDNLILRC